MPALALNLGDSPAMRYALQQRFWQREGQFVIKNEAGDTVMTTHPALFTLGNNVVFRDRLGADLATLTCKTLASRHTFEIKRGREHVAMVVGGRDPSMLLGIPVAPGKSTFTFAVDVPGPDDLTARGNVNEHEYTFVRGGRTVARVSKAWFTWEDSYGVDVDDSEDAVLVLAASVAIDMVISKS